MDKENVEDNTEDSKNNRKPKHSHSFVTSLNHSSILLILVPVNTTPKTSNMPKFIAELLMNSNSSRLYEQNSIGDISREIIAIVFIL